MRREYNKATIDLEAMITHVPVRVCWLGWDSDTYTLKRAGWEVWVGEQFSKFTEEKILDIALTDPKRRICIKGQIRLSMRMILQSGRMEYGKGVVDILRSGTFPFEYFERNDKAVVHSMEQRAWEAWDCMTLTDGLATISSDERMMYELPMFKAPAEGGREILISKASVDECFNRILQVQYPMVQDLKDKGLLNKPTLEAKIYTLAA